MGKNSKIAWCDHTFNPWIGCQRVSAGCDNCYAKSWNERYKRCVWGKSRVRTSEANWKQPLKWAKESNGAKVFCASLSDWLDNKVPVSWRDDLATLILKTPELTWLLLTKRIENYERLKPWKECPKNVWLGVTAENQEMYDKRWPILSKIDATVRFISYEPAIGYIEIKNRPFPDWVIMGGESGAKARNMPESWCRLMRDNCTVLDIPFFMKQMTGRKEPPKELFIREFPND